MKLKKRTKHILVVAAAMAVFLLTTTTAFAADEDPLQVVSNLTYPQ
jgi:hypothetical protein